MLESIPFTQPYHIPALLLRKALWKTSTHQRTAVQAVENEARYSLSVARQTINTVRMREVGMLVRKGGFSLALIMGTIDIPRMMPPIMST